MVKNIPLLTEQQWGLLRQKVEEITNEVTPEKIICFGVRTNVMSAWSCFAEQSSTVSIECHLLIIVKERDRRKAGELQDKVSALSSSEIRICSLIFGIESIHGEKLKGNDFFFIVWHGQVLFFDNNKSAILAPANLLSIPQHHEKACRIWERWYEGLGENFLDSALQDMAAQRTAAALFHLHQVAEHTLRALIEAVTGYRPATHSISRLLELSRCLTNEIADVFPCNTEEEGELLSTPEMVMCTHVMSWSSLFLLKPCLFYFCVLKE